VATHTTRHSISTGVLLPAWQRDFIWKPSVQ